MNYRNKFGYFWLLWINELSN